MTDTERLNWLEHQNGYALISNDFGLWAIVFTGMQDIPQGILDGPTDLTINFFIEKKDWYPSVREAIDAAFQERQLPAENA